MSTAAVETADFNKLPKYQNRTFIPENADLTDKDQVIAFCQTLEQREVTTKEDLEAWLADRSELDAALAQEGSILYIKMTCQTDDKGRADAYQQFIETVVPAIKPFDHKLNKKYLEARKRISLDGERYGVHDRAVKADVDLFIKENIPLQTQVSLLSQEYQTICGAMSVEFQGKEQTLQQVGKNLYEPDRQLRESAWRAVAERRLKDREKLDDLFDKMLSIRSRIGQNAGCKNFIEYQFRAFHRFDYTPEDCKSYHDAMEDIVVPIWVKILERRRDQMKLGSLRPWDTAVDPLGRPALKPFNKIGDLISGVKRIFDRTDSELSQQFNSLAEMGLLDLESRKGKAPGGYHNFLDETRKSFIFMNAVGLDSDVWTLLHEAGHGFHAAAASGDPLYRYRDAPMEFCEVASMGMELLGSEHISTFYNEEDTVRARTSHLEDVIFTLVWVANVDAFQQWIYENPNHTQEERTQAWLGIYNRFGGGFIDWSGLEAQKASLWHRQLHIFEYPFYYIEYGIAQLGALQLWQNAKKDRSKALSEYRAGLSVGGSVTLPEIFKTAGLKFDFSSDTVKPLVEAIKSEIGI